MAALCKRNEEAQRATQAFRSVLFTVKTTQGLGLTKNVVAVTNSFPQKFPANQNKIWKFFAKPVELKAPGSPAHICVTD